MLFRGVLYIMRRRIVMVAESVSAGGGVDFDYFGAKYDSDQRLVLELFDRINKICGQFAEAAESPLKVRKQPGLTIRVFFHRRRGPSILFWVNKGDFSEDLASFRPCSVTVAVTVNGNPLLYREPETIKAEDCTDDTIRKILGSWYAQNMS